MKCRIDAFSVLDMDTCYWVGYLLADGCISKTAISLTSVDKEVIDKYVNYLGGDTTAIKVKPAKVTQIQGKTTNSKELYAYYFGCRVVSSRLRSLGLVERKTFIVQAPEVLQNSRDFWRGYIEGNGHISIDKQERGILEISSGSQVILQQFLDYANGFIPLNRVKVTEEHGKGGWRVRFCGKYASVILKELYRDAPVVLTRKHEKVMKLLEIKQEVLEVMKSIPECSHCGSNKVVRNGRRRAGPRYLCRDCGRNTVIPDEVAHVA